MSLMPVCFWLLLFMSSGWGRCRPLHGEQIPVRGAVAGHGQDRSGGSAYQLQPETGGFGPLCHHLQRQGCGVWLWAVWRWVESSRTQEYQQGYQQNVELRFFGYVGHVQSHNNTTMRLYLCHNCLLMLSWLTFSNSLGNIKLKKMSFFYFIKFFK